jgi:transposase
MRSINRSAGCSTKDDRQSRIEFPTPTDPDSNERVQVIQLHAEGESYHSIAEDTSISKTQAQRIVKHLSDTGEVEPSPCRGRPQALND